MNNITLVDNDIALPAFNKCSSGYCSVKDYYYTVSKDASISSHDRLKQYIYYQGIKFELIYFISITFFNEVTFSNLENYDYSGVELALNISRLPSMPSVHDVDESLSLLLSWVSAVVFT